MKVVVLIILSINLLAQDGTVKSYFDNGNIQAEINFRDSIREGEAKFYYENGSLKEERIYVNGRVEGLVKIYSTSGILREIFVIENGRREGPSSIFNDSGNYVTDVYYEEGKLIVPETEEEAADKITAEVKQPEKNSDAGVKPEKPVRKSMSNDYLLPPQIEEEKLEDDPAFFSTSEVMPEPVGGMDAIYKKLIYPSQAKKNETTGTVKIQALIDEFGEVIDAQVLEGIGSGCDEVAWNAVYFAKFKPALQKGKPVRAMIVIPLKFNPGMNQN